MIVNKLYSKVCAQARCYKCNLGMKHRTSFGERTCPRSLQSVWMFRGHTICVKRSAFFLAGISVRSPQKIMYFHYLNQQFSRSKCPKNILFYFENRSTGHRQSGRMYRWRCSVRLWTSSAACSTRLTGIKSWYAIVDGLQWKHQSQCYLSSKASSSLCLLLGTCKPARNSISTSSWWQRLQWWSIVRSSLLIKSCKCWAYPSGCVPLLILGPVLCQNGCRPLPQIIFSAALVPARLVPSDPDTV